MDPLMRRNSAKLTRICLQFLLLAEARLAQSVERKALNLVVVGSSPTVGVVRQHGMNASCLSFSLEKQKNF